MKFIRIFIALLLIAGAFFKLFSLENFEILLVDFGIADWHTAPYLSRILTSVEITIGALLLLNIYPKQIMLANIVLVSIFSLFLLFLLVNADNPIDNCGCFGDSIVMTPLQSLVKNILILILSALYLRLYNHQQLTQKYLKLTATIVVVMSFVASFFMFPYNPNSHESLPENIESIQTVLDSVMEVKNIPQTDYKIIGFVSAHCNHCLRAVKQLQVVKKQWNLQHMQLFFFGEEDEVNYFIEKAQSTIEYDYLNDGGGYAITSGKVPTIILIEHGKITHLWTGRTFSLFEMNEFEKFAQPK